MASISRFSDDSEEKLNALIQKTIPEKTKIVSNDGIEIFKGAKNMNLKYQFGSFTRRLSQTLKIKTNEARTFIKNRNIFVTQNDLPVNKNLL